MKAKLRGSNPVCGVDLFCGAGGLTRGLSQAGIDVRLGVDVDPACEYPYTANNDAVFLRRPVEDLKRGEIEAVFPKGRLRLLAGCAPCQTFSKYNRRASPEDGRWWLLAHFSRLILEIQPEMVTMENVPGLAQRGVFGAFVDALKSAEYEVEYTTVNCAEYGIPQQRTRLVLLASRLGTIRLLRPKEVGAVPCSVREAIGHLPSINAGEVCKSDPMHQSSRLSRMNLRRIHASEPGGTWRDWRSDLVAKCHKRSTGKTYPSVYGRMVWDEPAPTITTQFYGFGNGRFGHPEQDRAISLREGAILQSFPNDYVFVRKGEPFLKKVTGRLVGNAVPVKLGKAIGQSIVHHVQVQGSRSRPR